jgi:hypothetical protein
MAQGSLTPYGAGSDPFLTLRREMDQLFDHMLQGFGMPMATSPAMGEAGRITSPRIDVSESDNECRITADLPGVAPADVSVSSNAASASRCAAAAAAAPRPLCKAARRRARVGATTERHH